MRLREFLPILAKIVPRHREQQAGSRGNFKNDTSLLVQLCIVHNEDILFIFALNVLVIIQTIYLVIF